MDESRGRFDEGTAMVIEALRTGFIEGDGPYFPQPRTEIRPRPERSFDDRLYAVASSDDSVEAAARFGGRMTMFADRAWHHRLPSIETYRARFLELHGRPAPPLMTADFCLCMADAAEAEEKAHQLHGHLPRQPARALRGDGRPLRRHRGVRRLRQGGRGAAARRRERLPADVHVGDGVGHARPDPGDLEQRRELIGPFEYTTAFRYGGIPYEEAEASMRLFAAEVLPVLHTWE